jgi:hypothetical protein
MNVQRFVLTRFAERTRFSSLKRDPLPLTSAWFERRFELFERYTLPSMKAQTEPDFTWLLCVDKDFPQVAERLQAYDSRIQIVRQLTPLPESSKQAVLSLRLDSDDALAPKAIELLSDRIPAFLQGSMDVASSSFVRGFRLNHNTGDVFYTGTNSLFLARYERGESRGPGVMCTMHHLYSSQWTTDILTDPEMWIIVSHGGNVANGSIPAGARKAEPLALFAHFPFLQETA